jgi:hypothetical protein
MRRKLAVLAAVPTAFILGMSAQILWLSSPGRDTPETLRETVAPGYELTGYYYPAPDFSLAFDNVRRIDLTTAEFRVNPDSSVTSTPTAPWGYLITDMDSYKMSSAEVGGGRISFTTETSLGVSYEFHGRVLAEGVYPVKVYSGYAVARTIMVEGRLVRKLFGLKVMESEVRFTKGSAC